MKRRSIAKVAVAAAGLALIASPALAQHNTPLKAGKVSFALVTTYNVCTAPNDTTTGGAPLPACTPPVLTSSTNATHVVTFGPKGTASVAVSVKPGDLAVAVKSADIHDGAAVIADGQQLGLHIDHTWTTTDNCTSLNPCTTIDVGPLFNGAFHASCLAGKCTVKTTVNTLVPGQISAGNHVNIELAGLGMNDQDGDKCFSEGLLIP